MKITIDEAANILKVSRQTIFKDRMNGARCGPCFYKLEGRYVAERSDVVKFKDEYSKIWSDSTLYARDTKIGVRFSEVELDRLKKKAKGRPLATYIRGRVL